jgi:Ca2+-binding EF-hand superfamily protein
MAPTFDLTELGPDELREAFDHFDRDDNGVIDRAEFGDLCSHLGLEASETDIDAGFRAMDGNGNGVVEFEEFVAWWRRL